MGKAQTRATNKYIAKTYKSISLRISRKFEKDIIDQLDKQTNKQGYIKELIRADIKNEENENKK